MDNRKAPGTFIFVPCLWYWYEYTTTDWSPTAVMFACCCGKGKKGKHMKVDASWFARAETRVCYPDIPWAYPGDVSFRPMFVMWMYNHAYLSISSVMVPGMVPHVIPPRYVAYISVKPNPGMLAAHPLLKHRFFPPALSLCCLLYTSDAADE